MLLATNQDPTKTPVFVILCQSGTTTASPNVASTATTTTERAQALDVIFPEALTR